MVLFLVGYMGCGKSSTGRKLAKRVGFGFVDMDTQIEQLEGLTIAQIFEQKGEARFRELEREWLCGVDSDSDMIVATGGGVPCHGDNMAIMNRLGVTVYFKMSPEKLVDRLRGGRDKRPLIRGMSDSELLTFIGENLVVRDPYYSEARMIIDCDGVSDEYVCLHVENYVKQTNKIGGF